METQLISLTKENIDKEHLCCSITEKKGDLGIPSKKAWLKERMEEGLKFIKLNVRGKVFIEYLPAENAWIPVNAPGYNFINCHWVSGSYKGKGYGKLLLDECEKDSVNKNGVVVLVGSKKKPFLPEKSFYLKHGYEVCDSAEPYFELLVKRFNPGAALPEFYPTAKQGMPDSTHGIDIFYTVQCPFTYSYIELIKPVISESDFPVRTHQITNKEEAQNHFSAVTTYSIFINGKFYSNEIHTPAKLKKLIDTLKV